YCASRNQSAPAIAYTTAPSIVLRCGTGNPVTLATLSPSDPTWQGPVWSWDGSAVAWITSNRLDVFRLGTAKLSSWDCANCEGLAFIGEQAVTQADASSSLPAAAPRLFVFPATGSAPPTTLTLSGIETIDGDTDFHVLATISATDIVVDYGDAGGSNGGGTQLLYRVNAKGVATKYGHDSFATTQTPSSIIGSLGNFTTDPTGHQLGLTESSRGGACGWLNGVVLLNTSSDVITMPAAPSGGGPGGYWVEGLWFDKSGIPYVSLVPNESTCTTTGAPPTGGFFPATATPTVWKLVDGHWVSAGIGTIQASDGPNGWTAHLTGTLTNGTATGASLNISHSGQTAMVAGVTGFEWAPTHR
ncbi:MAG TPA: hypothetical protein VH352_03680, partial [Pseudonocardiaceae bacterium]|nr:hypothetical protein [Pseudonocardiaceae bacterium]